MGFILALSSIQKCPNFENLLSCSYNISLVLRLHSQAFSYMRKKAGEWMGTFLSRQLNPELARNLSRAYTEGRKKGSWLRKDGDIKQACA